MIDKFLQCLKSESKDSLGDLTAHLEFFEKILCRASSEAEQNQVRQVIDWILMLQDERTTPAKIGKKLISAIERLAPLLNRTEEEAAQSNFPFELIPDKEIDLSFGQEFLSKCAEVHFDDLDLIEKAAIDHEAGDPNAVIVIKRFLHTMKGDFGVIGISDYADVVHAIEDIFESNPITADHVLRIKDFLNEAFRLFQRGIVPKLSNEIKDYLLNKAVEIPSAVPEAAPKTLADLSSADSIHELNLDETISNSESSQQENPEGEDKTDVHQALPSVQEDAKALERNLSEDPSLITDFIIESKEGLELVVPQIVDLDTGDLEIVNRLFRTCHTMKGLCGFIGLPCLGTYAHVLEDLLSEIRHGEVELSEDVILILQEAFDVLYEMILAVERHVGGSALKYTESLIPLYDKLLSNRVQHTAPKAPTPVENAPLVENSITTTEIHTPIEDVPMHHYEDAPKPLTPSETAALPEPEEKSPEPSANRALKSIAESKVEVDEMIRVSTRKLDQLLDTIGETVIAQSMLEADNHIVSLQDLLLEKKLAQSNLLIRRIQELSMSLRMVPIQGVFQKMARLIRDLSKKMNKNVKLATIGEETELDKSIVEQIADPLMHMVRNSLDHGLETIDERKECGKGTQGSLYLRAFNRSGAIVIEIEDDGRGLDTDRILAKAVNQGLCPADAVLSDQEIFKFIFHPGFSTAAKITDVSGRGVGMDVVKKNIDALRGSIVIQSEKGKGTLFSIRLPLTLAIIDGMVVRCQNQNLILPTLSIVQSVKCIDRHLIVSEPDGTFLYDFLGTLIPIVGILQIYGMSADKVSIGDGVIIIVEDMEGNRIGLLADEIVGQQQIVIKNLGQWLGAVPGIAGGAIMNSGAISLIVDIPELIRMCKQNDQSLQLVHWTEGSN